MTTSPRLMLDHLVTLDPYLAPVAQIRVQVEKLQPERRIQLLSLCQSLLADSANRSVEEDRISVVKVLVALLPDSLNEIERWLAEHSLEHAHEVHFSLFCFLDDVGGIVSLASLRPRVARLVEDYLSTVQSEDCFAAWMAGDLFGDHWATAEALPALLRVATGARNPAGRKGAIHGLLHLLDRVGAGSLEQSQIISLLERISDEDSDEEVRAYTAFVLKTKKVNRPRKGRAK